MTKFILVKVIDREVYCLGTYDTRDKAYAAMEEDYTETAVGEEDEFNDYDSHVIKDDWAWATNPIHGGFSDYDWKILEVEM